VGAYTALARATADFERTLATVFRFQKINYLALMMVDPHVHFHVIPRYSEPPAFDGASFPDHAWPKPPDVTAALPLTPEQMAALHARLRAARP
jgi:diadenosine tetraphosphate (Ap4A) HIT family hydrolase